MSQTETLLLVVLGFSLATLIALFVGRLLWSAALKLGARRMQKQVPSTLVGLQTERDRLRAEYAMLAQRMETRLEATRLKMAEQMAEVSRHRNRLETLEAERAANEGVVQGLRAEVLALTSQLETAKAIQAELEVTLVEKQEALDKALASQPADRRRPGPIHLPESPLADANPELRLRQRIERLNELATGAEKDQPGPSFSDKGSTVRHALPADLASDPVFQRKLEEAERETSDLQKELEQLDAEWNKRLEQSPPPEAGDQAGSQEPTAVANVISLANRIRDLKKGLSTG
jgi:hypothetical protein